ncbi:MAG: hypothetical protein K6G37_00100 [Bacilli bacterium]|nr:hypothetical protein [Bacilli bacterium]
MRQTIGSTWIYQLVIIFILIFVSFLTLSLTYSRAYKYKNEVLNIIEKNEGVTSKTIGTINSYLTYNSYSVKHSCPVGNKWYGVQTMESSNKVEETRAGVKYHYCLRKRYSTKHKVYYELKMFFKFNLPVVENVGTFTIDGTTNDVFETKDLLK